jgi:ATP-dependent helicase/nuclease subunit A
MNSVPSDQRARERFTTEWSVNFAVVANAGSGKTTAISERLAALALSPEGADALAHTTVVTYTKKAAAQIRQRARSVLLRRMAIEERTDAQPLARLESVFFGTIHSFCLLLARRHGSTLGIHLNPVLAEQGENFYWQEFIEQDPMTFGSLSGTQVAKFLRHESLDAIFELAGEIDHAAARRLLAGRPPEEAPAPSASALAAILEATAPRGKASEALARNKAAAAEWIERLSAEAGRLPFPIAEGEAGGIRARYVQFFAPLKEWLGRAGGVLAAELSLRYRSWRLERGIQTYSDQLETALAVVDDAPMLEKIRAEGWRVILDEAQDTDPKQFEVLVEIARPPGARRATWPNEGGAGPRAGHFCLVGDSQQGIYSDRANIRNFQRHVAAFERGDGGERLTFDVTFRTPRRVIRLLNETFPAAFGDGREHNLGRPLAPDLPERLVQVDYKPLVPGPANVEGAVWRLPLEPVAIVGKKHVSDKRLANEALQIARHIASGGPGSVGASALGDICILAPRNPWLQIVRDQFERVGMKTALQMRRNRNGDNPVYAWLCGLLAVVCDPTNSFEWVGILREIFAVSDADVAEALRGGAFRWDEPGDYPAAMASALRVMEGFIIRADLEGESLGRFASDLAAACGLAEKTIILDPEGGLREELSRLMARAAGLGIEGGGPRAWLRDLLGSVDEFRAWGRPASDAINIMTAHSAKGLEWPVVIPVGLWREIGTMPNHGLRLIREGDSSEKVILDNDGLNAETRKWLERARLRELVRLLYVTMTRAKKALILPWAEGKPERKSFAQLWGVEPGMIDLIPRAGPPATLPRDPEPAVVSEATGRAGPAVASPAPPFPLRVLPHQLTRAPDTVRGARHEASIDLPFPVRDGPDPLEYGVWWHEALELMPWEGDASAVDAHRAVSLAKARQMQFEERGREEWDRLLASEPWRLIRDPRWTRLAEVGVFAPQGPEGWIDGVIDLVLHDREAGELWIVDWKTNRRGRGEDDADLLDRLALEYGSQLSAYGASASAFFAGCQMHLWVYSTVAGRWSEVETPV